MLAYMSINLPADIWEIRFNLHPFIPNQRLPVVPVVPDEPVVPVVSDERDEPDIAYVADVPT